MYVCMHVRLFFPLLLRLTAQHMARQMGLVQVCCAWAYTGRTVRLSKDWSLHVLLRLFLQMLAVSGVVGECSSTCCVLAIILQGPYKGFIKS